MLKSSSILLAYLSGLLLSFDNSVAMNIAECDDYTGFTLIPDMNDFQVYVDNSVLAILDDESEVEDGSGGYKTYLECLAYATGEARSRLSTRTASGDKAFELSLSKVPFKIMGSGGDDHFAYSGECARGCVYTFLPQRLIRDICNSPDLFIHEYAHVLHLSVPDAPQSKAITAAYANFMSNELQPLATSYNEPYVKGECCFWYAAANEKEYFAVSSQAYFLESNEERWDWPRKTSTWQSEDAEGFDAVTDLWMIPEEDIVKYMSECKLSFFSDLDEKTAIMIVVGVAIVVVTVVVCCCWKICKRRGDTTSKRHRKESAHHQISNVEL